MGIQKQEPITEVAVADDSDLDAIFKMRHQVYARELRQHEENPMGTLSDPLDSFNCYIVAKIRGRIAGFISLTPPGNDSYSIDKYFDRADVPVSFDNSLYELRLLTVAKRFRGTMTAAILMYAALLWIENRGGRNLLAIGRVELLSLYLKAGLCKTGRQARSGALTFELLAGTVENVRYQLQKYPGLNHRFEHKVKWHL